MRNLWTILMMTRLNNCWNYIKPLEVPLKGMEVHQASTETVCGSMYIYINWNEKKLACVKCVLWRISKHELAVQETTDNIPQCKTEGPGPFSTQVKMCQTLVWMDKRIKEDDGEFWINEIVNYFIIFILINWQPNIYGSHIFGKSWRYL